MCARGLALILLAPTGDAGLRWDAPEGCPDHAAAVAEITARAGEHAAAALRADVHVVREGPDAYVVRVDLRGEVVGHRELRAGSCAEALTATAVVIAIAVSPPVDATASPTVPTVPDTPDAATTDATTDATTVDPATADATPVDDATTSAVPRETPSTPTPRRRRPALTLAARAGLDAGTVPGVAPLLDGTIGALGRRWHAAAGVTHRFAADIDAPGSTDLGGRFRVTAAHLVAGPRFRWGAFELPLRAGVELGALAAVGTGALEPRPVRRLWAAALLGAAGAWAPHRRVALQLGVDAVVPLWRPRFILGDAIDLATVGRAAVRAWLGVELRFSFDERPSPGKGTRGR